MKRARAVVLTIVVAFGITAVATATASAEAPEFGRCVKVAKGTGKLSSASCTAEKVGGSFEWTPGVGVGNTFTTEIKAGTIVMLLDSVEGTKITCHGETATGEYTSATTVGQVLLRFTACESSGGEAHSAGQPEGVVVSKTLEGSLGIIKRGATPKQNKIGLDLFPLGHEGAFTEFSVGGIPLVLSGSVIVPVTANKMQLSTTLKFAEKTGKQKPEQFVGQPRDVLGASISGGPVEQSGFGLESMLTNEAPIEINTVL